MNIEYPHINLTNGSHLAFWHNGQEPSQISSLINYRESPDPSGDVFFALVDVDGNVGVPEILNYGTYHSQYNPVVQELSDGNFVVAWSSSQDGNYFGFGLQMFSTEGIRLGTGSGTISIASLRKS